MNDTTATSDLYERFGFHAVGVKLPPLISGLMGYFGNAPIMGFYAHEELDRVMCVTQDGVDVCGNAGVLALIVHRVGFMRDDLIEKFTADGTMDSNLAILVEAGREDRVYIGTEDALFRFFKQARPQFDKVPTRNPEPSIEVKRGDPESPLVFKLTNSEFLAYKTAVNWFADLDGEKRPYP